MNKSTSILIIVLSWIIGISQQDCTFAVVVSLFLVPELFRKKDERINQNEI